MVEYCAFCGKAGGNNSARLVKHVGVKVHAFKQPGKQESCKILIQNEKAKNKD